MNTDNRPLEKYLSGDLVFWHSGRGDPIRAKVLRSSLTGKRIKIEYEYKYWKGAAIGTEITYVKPTSLSHRHE